MNSATPQPPLWEQSHWLLNHLEVGVMVIDSEQRILLWNQWLERHSELSAQNVIQHQLAHFFPEFTGSRLAGAVACALDHGLASLLSPGLNSPILRLYHRPAHRHTDQRLPQLVHVIPIPGEPRRCLIQIQDMTASTRREQQLRTQSAQLLDRTYRDPLTSVGNRRRFNETIATEYRRALRNQSSLALLMIDIDHFKNYNDAFGHPEGDQCLKKVAAALADALRDSGDLVARYGGEEFAVILPTTTAEGARLVAERLRVQVANSLTQNPNGPVTVSIGVAALEPSPDTELTGLISSADAALYSAKASGRNCVCCAPAQLLSPG